MTFRGDAYLVTESKLFTTTSVYKRGKSSQQLLGRVSTISIKYARKLVYVKGHSILTFNVHWMHINFTISQLKFQNTFNEY